MQYQLIMRFVAIPALLLGTVCCQDCFIEVVDPSGSFTDGTDSVTEYNITTMCVWNIHPTLAATEQLKVTFTRIDLGGGDYIDFDTYPDGTRVERLEGSYTNDDLNTRIFVGTAFKLSIFLVGTPADGHTGFELTYEVVAATCNGEQVFTARSGIVEDGSGDLNYDADLDCSFLIQPTLNAGEYLRFKMIDFITRDQNDVVELYHGNSTTDVLVHRMWTDYINYSPNQEDYFVSTAGAWYLHFTTDGTGTAKGWKIEYDIIDNPCQPIGAEDVAAWTWFTTSSGTVTDLSPPNTQYKTVKCWYIIQPPLDLAGGELVHVQMTKNDIHEIDRLKIFDDNTEMDLLDTNIGTVECCQLSAVTQEIIQRDTPPYMTFTSSFVAIVWEAWQSKADDHGYTGWEFEFDTVTATCDGTRTYTSNPSVFDDGSGSSDYGTDLDCYYLINPPIGQNERLRLRFWWIDLSVRTENDKISIIHGSSPDDPVVREVIDYEDEFWFYTPDDFFVAFQSTTKPFLVHFVTDNIGTADGFKIVADVVTRGDGPQCEYGPTYFTDRNGTVTDGSGVNEAYFKDLPFYGSEQMCLFVIAPALGVGEGVQISFTRFNVRPNDQVRIYTDVDVVNGDFNNDVLYLYGETEDASFSGDIFDFSDMVFQGHSIVVHFHVSPVYDELGSVDYFGFEFDYEVIELAEASISGVIWYDGDSDGVPGEYEGFVDVTVVLYELVPSNVNEERDRVEIAIVNTEEIGRFLFQNLFSGDYVVDFSDDSGVLEDYYLSTEVGFGEHIEAGQAVNTSFEYLPFKVFGGPVWNDEDANGIREAGETGFPDVVIELYSDVNGDEQLDDGDDLITTTTTDSNGNFHFEKLFPGGYLILLVDPEPSFFSDWILVGDNPNYVELEINVEIVDENFGFYQENGDGGDGEGDEDGGENDDEASISGVIFRDNDNDGDPDQYEGFNHVTVVLYELVSSNINAERDSVEIATAETDGNGRFSFLSLYSGDYVVDITDDGGVLEGFYLSAEVGFGEHIEAGQAVNASYAYLRSKLFGGPVWNDENADKIFDADETGFPDIVIKLYSDDNGDEQLDDGDDLIATTTTNNNGYFQFENLLPGGYLILLVDSEPSFFSDWILVGDNPDYVELEVNVEWVYENFGFYQENGDGGDGDDGDDEDLDVNSRATFVSPTSLVTFAMVVLFYC